MDRDFSAWEPVWVRATWPDKRFSGKEVVVRTTEIRQGKKIIKVTLIPDSRRGRSTRDLEEMSDWIPSEFLEPLPSAVSRAGDNVVRFSIKSWISAKAALRSRKN